LPAAYRLISADMSVFQFLSWQMLIFSEFFDHFSMVSDGSRFLASFKAPDGKSNRVEQSKRSSVFFDEIIEWAELRRTRRTAKRLNPSGGISMFEANRVSKLSIPLYEGVYRTELSHGAIAIIAVHDTTRGWALGGCRMAIYANEAEALTDVLRLSRGMTFKNAIADLPLGGGKSVIICDPKISGDARNEVLEDFGRFVSWVNRNLKRYCTAEDMNTTVADMLTVNKQTKFIHGTTVDPSPSTAFGVFSAIEHAVEYFAEDLFDGDGSLRGKSVLIQGLGKVGWDLLERMVQEGARCVVTDIRQGVVARAVESFPGVTAIDPTPEALLQAECDIFAPCALGGVINKDNVGDLPFKIICGSANNQLQSEALGSRLHQRGIVYCPDYVANMGGVCCIQYLEIMQLGEEENLKRIRETVRRQQEATFRTGFEKDVAFNLAVNHVVKDIVWGTPIVDESFRNGEAFPQTHRRVVEGMQKV
jgi:leucine dehydrogenase